MGSPTGRVLQIDLAGGPDVDHDVDGVDSISALTVTAAGEVLLGTGSGDLLLFRKFGQATTGTQVDLGPGRARVAAFVAATTDLPDDADLDDDLELTDGVSSWAGQELAGLTTASESDPVWLQMKAAIQASMPENS